MSITSQLLPTDATLSSLPADTNKPIPVHEFLKNCELNKYYRGLVYKQQNPTLLTGVKSLGVMAVGYMEFIVYKFEHQITVEKKETFCITFRKKHTSLFNNLELVCLFQRIIVYPLFQIRTMFFVM